MVDYIIENVLLEGDAQFRELFNRIIEATEEPYTISWGADSKELKIESEEELAGSTKTAIDNIVADYQ